MKEWKKIFQANGTKKQAGIGILLYNKIDVKPKLVRRVKESHFIFIKGKPHQENNAILEIRTPTRVHSIL